MADQTSTAIGAPGDTLPTLALTTVAKTYDFTYSSTGRPLPRIVAVKADADFLISTPGTSNYTLVAANQPYRIMLTNGTKTINVKTPSGTATLYAVICK
jgi:hypothetical protein